MTIARTRGGPARLYAGPVVPDPIFDHPRLAAVYDAFEGERPDLEAYLELIDELGAETVIDLGCGTGSLALLLAGRGRTVTGVDPAGASLDVARAKPGADRVRWIVGDAGVIPPDGRADLVTMTGNAAQAVTDDDAWTDLLDHVRKGLRPGGSFVFETRRPEAQAWLEWAVVPEPVSVDVPGIGMVEQRRESFSVALPYVTFGGSYRFPDGVVLHSTSTLRFRSENDVRHSLGKAGFTVREVRQAPDRPGREFVFIAER